MGSWASAGAVALLLMGGFGRPHGRGTPADEHGSDDDPGTARRGGERGRFARTPSGIPPRGWRDILLRVYQNISEDRLLAIAAGVTYYVILAIFPAFAALVSIYGLFADPSSIGHVMDSLSSALPGGAIEVVRNQLHMLTSQPRGRLGVALVVSVLISLWSANSGIKAVFDALNVVYHEPEKRSFVKLNAQSLLFTTGAMVAGVIGVALIAAVPATLNHRSAAGISGPVAEIIGIGRWPLLLIAVAVAMAVVFRYGPSRRTPRWRWVTWGSGIASILWLAASLLFSWYVANFSSYNKTYGSLAAAIIFMTWMWISFVVILLGAEIDAEMEHQTIVDSTTGRPKPLGRRGAKMADTVGAARN